MKIALRVFLISFIASTFWFIYFLLSFEVSNSKIEHDYMFLEKNKSLILKKIKSFNMDPVLRESLSKHLLDDNILQIDYCNIVPVTVMLDRFRNRERYYLSFYSSDSTEIRMRSYRMYAYVYLYGDVDIVVDEVGKIWD
jgi:hypothetical protein